jgi:hypothetical protein
MTKEDILKNKIMRSACKIVSEMEGIAKGHYMLGELEIYENI